MIVSIICPCRNEVRYIDAFLDAVTQQQARGFLMEILVAEGDSDDGTAEALAAWTAREPRLRIVPNPGRIVSSGLNAAIRLARGDIIVRMDVHTEYAPDYVSECVAALTKTKAKCVGGPWVAKGRTARQRAIAAAFGSPFGSGGAKSRRTDYSGPVDTVYLGAWERADLDALGGFDEALVRNQDDELCLRIIRSGGTVWQSAAIRSAYVPRSTLGALWRQFHQYGYWKVAVIRKHRLPASIRQLVPTLFVFVLMALLVAGFLMPLAWLALAALLLAYASAALVAAGAATTDPGEVNGFVVALSFACMHLGYGLGFARGVIDFFIVGRQPAVMSRLTR